MCHAVFSILYWVDHELDLQWYLFAICLISRYYLIMLFPPVFEPVVQLMFTMLAPLLLHMQQKNLEVLEVFLGSENAGSVIKDCPG